MKIRRFRNGDEISLFNVFYSSVHTIALHYYTQEQIDAWAPAEIEQEQWANHMRELCPFVVELDGEIAGYADLQPNGFIDHFYVSGTYSGQGVGTLLMNCIHEEARQHGTSELTSNVSKAAEAFFLRHGFHVVERGFPICRGITLENALMRKHLAK
ncbi:GNAT family N-acetyltransferase [Enterobacter hormaechei subsp. xiangfangensis]|uniref:GNAT family N-acetyltransferase n=1 Tax=Enterobacter cloacae complex TaxID=354276 RepID=UPI00095002F2|nr:MULTISPECIES: GNAT family N-acetyltransferase [Enterobacter cloacae complex]ELC7452852.1 GNAT family N-acetyltransferase [Enterobacter hormaechei]ELJ6236096.1 GNAT family N-acetyltransferase [Enterobacter hormaechei]ELZ5039556.1 GNAT family N-acetyltransferase [Enterobacter hormaechei]MBT1743847.1 GNAT family N-acetyltransferase [Enterobacter hormaechei subsp. xiangfangensis]MCM8071940.1 GNAT family N-acetyltransferase [Enterobacter hormaechei]